MKANVIIFPASNCNAEMTKSLKNTGFDVSEIFYKDSLDKNVDLIAIPGGFSYGDYLRSGAIASVSNIAQDIISMAKKGVKIIGVCNGFQILTEIGLLEGALLKNINQKFICRDIYIKTENKNTPFTQKTNDITKVQIAHMDGRYYAETDKIKELYDNNLIAFKYCDKNGEIINEFNPNGSIDNIAGVFNKDKNILGMMPHPERFIENGEGHKIFQSLFSS
jgi:phosphoribosylformylglycinamidine synthase